MKYLRIITTAIALAGCATQPAGAPSVWTSDANQSLRLARKTSLPIERRVGYYLDAAKDGSTHLAAPEGRALYNTAAGELCSDWPADSVALLDGIANILNDAACTATSGPDVGEDFTQAAGLDLAAIDALCGSRPSSPSLLRRIAAI